MMKRSRFGRAGLLLCAVGLGVAAAVAVPVATRPLHVLVTGRGPGNGYVEELWRPLVDRYGMRISAVYTVHINPYYVDHGSPAYAGALSADQEQRLIALLTPSNGAPVDVALIGGRSNVATDQADNFMRMKEMWHPGDLTEPVQRALVQYVKAGGILILNAQIFRPQTVTATVAFSWKGGPLDEILPTEELRDALPFMDGRPREQWGNIAYRAVGQGKVMVVELRTPAPTSAEMTRREFDLWGPLIRWCAYGNAVFPVTVAAEFPARELDAGTPLTAKVTVRNYATDAPVCLRLTAATADGVRKFFGEQPVPVARGGTCEVPITIPTANDWLTGAYTLDLQLFTGKDPAVAAELSEPFHVAGVLDLAVQTDRDGYAATNVPVLTTVTITNRLAAAYPPLVLHAEFRDVGGRVLQQADRPVALTAAPSAAVTVGFTMKDYPRGVYWIDAVLRSGKAVWSHGEWPVYRYGRTDGNEELIWTMWTSEHSPQWLRLFRDTGLNAIADDFQAAERWGFKVWTRNGYQLRLDQALPEEELKARFGKLFAAPLAGRRDPSVWHPALTLVCQDGENGWPLLLHGAAQKAPFTAWLQQRYPSLEALNAEWGKTYATWDEIEFHEPNSGYGVFPPAGVKDPVAWNDQEAWITDQAFRYHQLWSQALRAATPYGARSAATACAWSPNAGTDVLDLQCAQPWISTADFFWQATRGRPQFGTAHSRSTHWAFVANRPVLATAFWGAIAAGSRTIDMWTPVFPEKTAYPSWDGTFNIYRPSCQHSPASLDIQVLIAQIARKQGVLMDSWSVPSRDVAYYELARGAAAEDGLFGHLFHSGFLPDLLSGPQAELGKYAVILASGVNSIDPATAQRLTAYVGNGGLLVTFPGFAATDTHGKPFANSPGLGMDEVLGITVDAAPKVAEGAMVVRGTHPALALPAGTRLAVWANPGVQQALTVRSPATEVLAVYEHSGQPAFTLHPFGKGAAVHVNFGIECGPAYAGQNRFVWRDETWDEMRRLLEGLLLWGKATRPFVILDVGGRGIPPINAGLLTTADGVVKYLIAYSDYRQEHSRALDLATGNDARQKVSVPATQLPVRQSARVEDAAVILEAQDAYAEGPVIIPEAGRYQMWLEVYFDRAHMAAGQTNALRIAFDGKNDPPDNASGPERMLFGNTPIADQWLWQSGRWFDLEKGTHALRITALGAPIRVRNVLLISPPALAARAYLTDQPTEVYDVYAGARVALRRDARGVYLPLALQPGEGKVFALLPCAASAPRVSLDRAALRLGNAVTVTVSNTTPGIHSMRLTVAGPDGQELRALRREFPLQTQADITLFTALNDPQGRWTVGVEDETTGQQAATRLKVEPAALQP